MGQKAVRVNYKLQHGVAAMVRKKLRSNDKWQKIDTSLLRVCEVGKRLKNPDCQENAYRKVKSRLGEKYTCDSCALLICRLNELNWNWDEV